MVKFGQRVKDVVTGFVGIVVGRAEYMTGCTQYCVNPGVDKEGKPMDPLWIDEARLAIVDHAIVVLPGDTLAQPGGPQRDAPGRQG